MIKFMATDTRGRKLIGLAISDGNLKHLRDKRPLVIHNEDWFPHPGPGFDITIMWGETEAAIEAELKPLLSKDTKVHGDYTKPPKKN